MRTQRWYHSPIYAATCTLAAIWGFVVPSVVDYLDTARQGSLMMAAGYAVFCLAMGAMCVIDAPANAGRWPGRARWIAQGISITGFGVALVGIALKYAK